MVLGFLIAIFIDEAWYWRLSWTFIVCSTFYFGGHGLWGSCVVYRGIVSITKDAFENNKLNIFHADRLCGFGFARNYADIATMFMLSGSIALPMGIMLGSKCMSMQTSTGYVLSIFVALAIFIWGVFALLASLLGRKAIASAIIQHRDPLLYEIANKKKDIINTCDNLNQIEALNIQEDAASNLRTGIFIGAGAWKDMFNVGIVGLALFNYLQELHKMISITS